jgi:hypothetical protein
VLPHSSQFEIYVSPVVDMDGNIWRFQNGWTGHNFNLQLQRQINQTEGSPTPSPEGFLTTLSPARSPFMTTTITPAPSQSPVGSPSLNATGLCAHGTLLVSLSITVVILGLHI